MMRSMNVEEINIGPSDALAPVGSVSAIAGKGLVGDRQFFPGGADSGEALTLIEAEVLEDVGMTGAQSRRQVVVRGVRLNDLVGRRFRVGDVECAGVKLAEPCTHLQSADLARDHQRPDPPRRAARRHPDRRQDLGRRCVAVE